MSAKNTIDYTKLTGQVSFSSAQIEAVYQAVKAAELSLDAYPLNQYFDDSLAITESTAIAMSKVFDELVSLQENSVISVSKLEQETVSLVDSITTLLQVQRTFSESLSLSETTAFTINKSFSETLSLTDVFDYLLETGFIGENLSLQDAPAVDFSTSKQDSFAVSDVAIFASSLSANDAFGFNENFQAGFNQSQNVNNAISVLDNFEFLLIAGDKAVLNTSALNTFTLNS